MAELVRVERISKDFVLRRGPLQRAATVVHAVRDATLEVAEGATLGLVGESGSGKSTLARLILGLDTPTSGEVLARGRSLRELGGSGVKDWHQEAPLIFQDAYGALSPRMRTGRILAEPLRLHRRADKGSVDAVVTQLLRQVGLDRRSPTAILISSPLGNASGLPSPARSPSAPRCWSATSRSAHSTSPIHPGAARGDD